jgi:hypothetical protein
VKESGMDLGTRNGTKWSARAATTFNCAAAIVCSFSAAQRRMLRTTRTDVSVRTRTPARTTYPNGAKDPGGPPSTARLTATRVLRRPGRLNSFNKTQQACSANVQFFSCFSLVCCIVYVVDPTCRIAQHQQGLCNEVSKAKETEQTTKNKNLQKLKNVSKYSRKKDTRGAQPREARTKRTRKMNQLLH